ncbi:MAG: aspartate racemase [Candidatus Pacebacteria bacterium CG_4_10_14_0_8_um_filter_42_14]|nr:MAG: aspartate racemase [Candidatus Pacebacteria bacterium CG_4_10_14_0_8_um_filter_42_14]
MHLKTIGLLGGVGWTSTMEYYRRLNEAVYHELGGHHSAKILLSSVNFDDILRFQSSGNSEAEENFLRLELSKLERAGADCIAICSNTTNKTAESLARIINIPLLNLPELVAQKVASLGVSMIGLLGTKYVMYGSFYKNYFSKLGIEVIVPNPSDGASVHTIIYDELVKGSVLRRSAVEVDRIASSLMVSGAEVIVYGCTELPLLLKHSSGKYPVIDTIAVHVEALRKFIFPDEKN